MEQYTVGKSVPSWGGADVQVITFTCSLTCKITTSGRPAMATNVVK